MADKNAAKKCAFCLKGEEIDNICGDLMSSPSCTAHRRCMQYSSGLSQYKFDSFGGFDIDEVEKEIKRGKKLACSECRSKRARKELTGPTSLMYGGTAGCSIAACKKTFHYPCAKLNPKYITERILTKIKDKTGEVQDVVKYRTFCSKEHFDMYMARPDTQQEPLAAILEEDLADDLFTNKDDIKDIDEYCGEPLADYLSDEENPGQADVSLKSPGPLSPISDQEVDESDSSAKRRHSSVDSDDLPIISPVKRLRTGDVNKGTPPILTRLNHESESIQSNPSSRLKNSDLGAGIGGKILPASTGPSKGSDANDNMLSVKEEPVENEVSSTSQRPETNISSSGGESRPSETSPDSRNDGLVEETRTGGKACALCFLDKTDLSEEYFAAVKETVHSSMKVDAGDIMFWQDVAKKRMYWQDDTHMRYFMLDIVKSVRDQNFDLLLQLLLQPDERLDQYKGQHSFTGQFMGEILECLQKILQTQIDHYSEQSNKNEALTKTLLLDRRAGKTFIFVLLLNDTTDSTGTLRGQFSKPFVMHLLNRRCEFKHRTLPDVEREALKEREISTLRLWLKSKTNNDYEAHLYPTEEMLLVIDDSVAWQLSQELIIGSTGHAKRNIVFFRAINNDIINHKAYCHKVMKAHMEQLTEAKKVFFVFDVCAENGYSSWEDLVPEELRRESDALVWSCFDPQKFPVTCVVVLLMKD